MRLLVYGMQSSGATTFTRVLAERPGCIAMTDIGNQYLAPRISTAADFVAKVVVTAAHALRDHVAQLAPDRVVLFIRNPHDNYVSLQTKDYRDGSGAMDDKFRLLEEAFRKRDEFDAVVAYEDFVARDAAVEQTMAALGWPIQPAYYSFRRSYDDLLASLWREEPALQHSMNVVFGNSRGREVSRQWQRKPHDSGLAAKLDALCPELQKYYAQRRMAACDPRGIGAPKPLC